MFSKIKKIFLFVLIGFGVIVFLYRGSLRVAITEYFQKRNLPDTVSIEEVQRAYPKAVEEKNTTTTFGNEGTMGSSSVPQPVWNPTLLPLEMNLFVPFVLQAPFANWALPYQEACEEASVLMVQGFFDKKKFFTPQEMDKEILKLVEWQKKRFGYYEDTTAEEVAVVLREYVGLENVRLVYDPSIKDIQKAVGRGHLVIVPAHGTSLPNPYFRNGGPLYHMLVVRGYTETRFITNDPGTKRGENFTYAFEDLYQAIHDWNGGDVPNGRKVMIIID